MASAGYGKFLKLFIAVILLAAVGAVLWWYSDRDQSVERSEPLTTAEQTADTPKEGFDVELAEWGVGADYADGQAEINYQLSNNRIQLIGTKLALNASDRCSFGDSGTIGRFAAKDNMSNKPLFAGAPDMRADKYFADNPSDDSNTWKKVGDYYYMYVAPQTICSINHHEEEIQAVQSARQVVNNLESL